MSISIFNFITSRLSHFTFGRLFTWKSYVLFKCDDTNHFIKLHQKKKKLFHHVVRVNVFYFFPIIFGTSMYFTHSVCICNISSLVCVHMHQDLLFIRTYIHILYILYRFYYFSSIESILDEYIVWLLIVGYYAFRLKWELQRRVKRESIESIYASKYYVIFK